MSKIREFLRILKLQVYEFSIYGFRRIEKLLCFPVDAIKFTWTQPLGVVSASLVSMVRHTVTIDL